MDSGKDLGAWEKHTKGIGKKLLEKFGFKGRLGAKETGVSRAVEVLVRPTNQGLGFGDGIEASSLRVNKKIEAEWRLGADFKEEDFPDVEEPTGRRGKKHKKSAIELMADAQSWKKVAIGEQRFADTTEDTTETSKKQNLMISATDFINDLLSNKTGGVMEQDKDSFGEEVVSSTSQKQVIIDMRHADTRILTDLQDINTGIADSGRLDGADKPKLGQELLYNVNLIADLEEIELTKHSKLLSKETNRIDTINSDIKVLTNQMETDTTRLRRLEKIAAILDRIQSKMDSTSASDEIDLEAVCSLFQTLHSHFTEEFSIFGLMNLLPNLLSHIIKAENWSPSKNPDYLLELHDRWAPLTKYFYDKGENVLASQTLALLQKTIEVQFMTMVRRYITNEWRVHEPEDCLKVLSSLQLVIQPTVFTQTVDMMVMPKLTTAVGAWKHSSDPPFHTWLHPWLPLLQSKLSAVYPEVRRRLGHYCSNQWRVDDSAALQFLQPWKEVFDQLSYENLLVRSVLPKLVSALKHDFVVNPQDQDIAQFQGVVRWHEVMPPIYMTSLLCGEFFPKWLRVLKQWLVADAEVDFEEVSQWYSGWKSMIPANILSDDGVTASFNLALEMIQTCLTLDSSDDEGDDSSGGMTNTSKGKVPKVDQLASFEPVLLRMDASSFSRVLEKRKLEVMAQSRLEELQRRGGGAGQAHSAGAGAQKGKHRHVQQPFPVTTSLKAAVETFAERGGMDFAPKPGKYHDGKPVWQFGSRSIVFENDVIFVQQSHSNFKTQWVPITLQDLFDS